MSNSPLVSYTKISPNRTSPRNAKICYITPHCVVGQCTVETLGNIFAPVSRQASSNYGIGRDGRVGMYCPEKDRSWCSSSAWNDNRAVTIEVASDTKAPYAVNKVAYKKLIELCVDICERNGKTKLLFLGSLEKTQNYKLKPHEMALTAHRWFANTMCPGEYLYSRFGKIAKKVTKLLDKKIKYRAYDLTKKEWLPPATNTTDVKGVGKVGDPIGAFILKSSTLKKYRVKREGEEKFDKAVKKYGFVKGSYAGDKKTKIIDVAIDDPDVAFRVKLGKTQKWLPVVYGKNYDLKNQKTGYAGNDKDWIDRIEIWRI